MEDSGGGNIVAAIGWDSREGGGRGRGSGVYS